MPATKQPWRRFVVTRDCEVDGKAFKAEQRISTDDVSEITLKQLLRADCARAITDGPDN